MEKSKRLQLTSVYQTIVQQSYFPLLTGMITLLFYLIIVWVVLEPTAVWTVDTGAKWLQLDSLRWENGLFAYDIQYPNQETDPAFVFANDYKHNSLLSVVDGQLQLRRLPLFPLLTLPFYRLFGAYGLYILPAVGAALISVLTLLFVPQQDRRFSMWLLIAFASPVFFYAMLFWEHTPAAAVTLFAVWRAFQAPPITQLSNIWQWVGIGVLLGFAAYLRLEVLIFSLTFLGSCWLLLPKRRWGLVLAGAIVLLIMLFYQPLHGILFSQPVPENAAYVVRPGTYISTAGWRAISDLLVGTSLQSAAETGWWGLVWAAAAVITIVFSLISTQAVFVRWLRWVMLAVTAVIAATYLFESFNYHAAHGLLFTTPWLLLALFRSCELWQYNQPYLRVIVLTTLLGLLGYAIAIVGVRFGPPHGGLEWGARFAIVFYPFSAIMAGWDFQLNKLSIPKILIIGSLISLGIGFQMRGLTVLQQDKRVNHELNQAISATIEPIILTDIEWLPLNAAPIYDQKNIYLVDDSNLREWVKMMQANQLHHFTLVTFDNDLPQRIARMAAPDSVLITHDAQHFGHFFFFTLTLTPL